MRTLRYRLCDVFTDRPFAGNPLAVFTEAAWLGSAAMQALAREMNLSETSSCDCVVYNSARGAALRGRRGGSTHESERRNVPGCLRG
ncbi:PhzF family phenazine biosynthesis protein [Sorangium sp. So ce131]